MKLKHVTLVGLVLVSTSLVAALVSSVPEVGAYEDCREVYVPALRTLFVYWGNYSIPNNLENITLTVVNPRGILLNISYGISPGEAYRTVSHSAFSYFVGNSTYFYLFVVPYEDAELRVCLTGLITTFRSYLLLPTLILWVAGTVIVIYATLMYFERIFAKPARGKK